jgi:hypothetical protein
MFLAISAASCDGIVDDLNVKHTVVLVTVGAIWMGLLGSARLAPRLKVPLTTLFTALVISSVTLFSK